MKTLVYTVSDFSPGADSCINMLCDSIDWSGNVDFCVVATREIGGKFKHKVVIETHPKEYPGFMKSSKVVPKGYDRYVYLDSDIFYFGSPNDLFHDDKDFSIVFEERTMIDRWYAYEKAPREDKLKMEQILGMNAGNFCFKDLSFLEEIRALWGKHVTNSVGSDARLEQSSFNYAVCKRTEFDLTKCHDLTPITQLQAAIRPFDKNKTLYHFTGAPNTMAGKAYVMGQFLNNFREDTEAVKRGRL